MRKYSALQSISTVYRIGALIISIVGVIAAVASMVGRGGNILTGLSILVGALITALTMQAFAELIQLALDAAADIHVTADYFRRRSEK